MTQREDAPPNTDTPLWRFALAVWQREEVSKLCLELQSRGWSVTRILSAGWLAREGRFYGGVEPEAVTQWRQNVTESIRSLRQSLSKSDSLQALVRQSLLKAELEAERVELYRAWRALREPPEATERGMKLVLGNLRQAAPQTDDPSNEMTDAMIRKLAPLLLDTAMPASDAVRSDRQ